MKFKNMEHANSIFDFKTIFLSFFSISAIELSEKFAIIYPILTKCVQLGIGLMTVIYLYFRIRNERTKQK